MNVRESIGKYELIKPLGTGATSVVYESYHPELNRTVAIKLLNHDRILDEQSLSRFRAEGEKLATLRHPHIVTIYDANYLNGRPYIVTELLEGHDLDTYISRYKSFSLTDILDIALQLSDALVATHAKNIVHRDVKLSNIMVTRKDNKIHITLMDYGIARNDHTYTEEGHFIGTHAYASPEQLCCERVDHRSDIYSLGVVLYVLISNMLPSNSLFQIKNAIPVKLGDIAQVPGYISKIIDKCLEKQPKDRFQSAEDLKNALTKAKRRYQSTRFTWWRKCQAWFSRPIKLAISNALIAMLILFSLYPFIRNQFHRYQASVFSQSVAAEAGIIAAYLEETLALHPERLTTMLASPIYSQQYDKLVLLDQFGSVQASMDNRFLAGTHYSIPGRAWVAKAYANQILYFPPTQNSLADAIPTLTNWWQPSLDELIEVDYQIRIKDKLIGHVILKRHGDTQFEAAFHRYFAIASTLLFLIVFTLSYRATRKLNRFLEYAQENIKRSMTDVSLRHSRQSRHSQSDEQAWSGENAPIPFDWEGVAAAVAADEMPLTKAADRKAHTAREQLKLAAHFDAVAREKSV